MTNMAEFNIISYNLNGIRAATKKGLLDWVTEYGADVYCFQETKAHLDQLTEAQKSPEGYHGYFYSAEKKGYSGVAIYSKKEPNHVEMGCGIDFIDEEGRVLRADFDKFSVISLYAPSGTSGDHRQSVKEEFMKVWPQYIQNVRKDFPNLLISGDYNIAHTEMDIHDPVGNKKNSGYLPHERQWLTDLLESGWVDTFRYIHPDARDEYSWWSYRTRAREKNKGWRIDYHLASQELMRYVADAAILQGVVHSDHCPIKVRLQF